MIEIVACNLYPFSDAASTEPPLEDLDLLEMIDIGGRQWFGQLRKIIVML